MISKAISNSTGLGRIARLALTCGVSGAALMLASAPALAEEAAASSGGGSDVSELVVTGSRLRQDGMLSPTPVTVVGAVELEKMSPTTLIEGITQLPQFFASQTPNSGNWFIRSGYGNLNLRGLGVNRTLTLLSGRRVISATAFGGVDVNVFPSEMMRSVETVTGGASAAYGTDAVAGVVNFILDTDFNGLRVSAQAGETTREDAQNWSGAFAYGTNIGEKLHVMVAGEYFNQEGVHSYEDRGWYKGYGTIVGPNNMLLIRPNVVSRNATFDGLISLPGSALNGLAFNRDGSVSPFVTSSESSGTIGTPAARHSIASGGSGDDLGAEVWTLYPDFERYSAFGYADYDINDEITVYAQFIHSGVETFAYNTPRGSLHGQPTSITIFQDNAFLPANVRQIMIAENRPSFTLKRMGSALDIGRDISIADKSIMNSFTTGFDWNIDNGGFMDGWQVKGYYQYGRNERRAYQVGLRVDRIFAAVDAVRDPATGNIVCRTTLFSNAFAGCQPLNLFGRGRASPGAVDWVVGNDVGEHITTPLFFADTGFTLGETDDYTAQEAKVTRISMRQHVAELTLNGDLYKGWGAGPIRAAFGASYREESIRQIVRDSTNKSSDHSAGHPVLCNTDAAAIAAGLRGVSQPDCLNTVGVQFSKVSNIQGKIDVKELFGEIQIPILADVPLFRSLQTNLAARWADYSGSGTVWAYKAGVDWDVVDGFRLRGTYSRDVRAANLSERFDKTGGAATVTDPRYPGDGPYTVTIFSGGNPNVLPEEADTFTVGAIVRPPFIPGLSVSADWYKINIDGAIGQLGTQNVVNQCEAGATALCSLITRSPATDRLVLVGNVFVNINKVIVSGVDVEANYSHPIDIFDGEEQLSARFFGSWLDENSQQLQGAAKIDRAGQTGIQQSDGLAYALPEFKATANLTYINGPFSLFLQERYIGKGKIENALVEGVGIESNRVDSAWYTDLRIGYRFEGPNGGSTEFFGTINNLFDYDPPVTPYYSAFAGYAQQYNAALFDVLGRRFVIGAKFSY